MSARKSVLTNSADFPALIGPFPRFPIPVLPKKEQCWKGAYKRGSKMVLNVLYNNILFYSIIFENTYLKNTEKTVLPC